MNRLKQLRDELGESQEYIGTLIGVSGQAVGQYEAGKRGLSQDKILILANHFNVSTDYLLCNSNVREPIDIDKIQFANSGGLDTNGLTDRDIEELKAQIEFKRKYNSKKKKKENK